MFIEEKYILEIKEQIENLELFYRCNYILSKQTQKNAYLYMLWHCVTNVCMYALPGLLIFFLRQTIVCFFKSPT